MKLKTKNIIILMGLLLGVSACSKWNDPISKNIEDEALKELFEQRDKHKWEAEDAREKENQEAYQQYLKNLRAYKESEHPIMFGWFNAWNPEAPGKYSKLTLLPDSMDVVSIWGNWHSLNEDKIKELREVQEKGTKVVIGWIVQSIGDQIVWGRENWADNDYDAIEDYAQAIVDTIAKYDYDGFDCDYEPSYASPWKPGGHCGDIVSCSQNSGKEKENFFFKRMREKLDEHGQKVGRKMLFHLNGSIDWLTPSSAKYFDRFVIQSYNGYFNTCGSIENLTQKLGISTKQILFTESFENKPHNRPTFVSRYAKMVVSRGRDLGGIGVYHINEDAHEEDTYKNVREAITTMNPPIR